MDQLISLTKKLIKIPSTKGNAKSLAQVLEVAKNHLSGFRFKSYHRQTIPSLLFYNTLVPPKRFKLILNAHLDVVPASKKQYKATVKGNKLYGRGAYDMKAAAAAEIIAFKDLAAKVNYPLGLQLVTDEEWGGFYGTKHQIQQGIRADFVLAGEPTDLEINHKSKGTIWAKVSCSGKSAHGAYPWLGDNAIWKMNSFLAKLKKTFPVPKKEVWKNTVNLSKVETSNLTTNKVPDDCTATLDLRYIPKDQKTIQRQLKKILPQGFKLELIAKEPPHLTAPNNPFIGKLKQAVKQATGKTPPTVAKHGGSDVRHFNAVGCPGITFSPQGLGHHTDTEWVSLQSLKAYHQILINWLLSLDK